MDNITFCALWLEALSSAGFDSKYPLLPDETINLHNMARAYNLSVFWTTLQTPPFSVTSTLSWSWDALLSARFNTTEEDMLMQIFGNFDIHDDDSVQPWLRIDVSMIATLPYQFDFPPPSAEAWRQWVLAVDRQLAPFFQTKSVSDFSGTIDAYFDTPRATIRFDRDGTQYLNSIELSAWQGITLPRQWDNPNKWDVWSEESLYNFAQRIKKAVDIWTDSLKMFHPNKE